MATTSGLIQRLKWVPGLHALFVYVGPVPTATRLMLVLFDDPDPAILATRRATAAVLAKALGAGRPVSLRHQPGATAIEGVDLGNAFVQVDGIEVTQAIQTLAHTIELLAGKGTVARLYLSSRLTMPVTVRGTLRVARGGSTSFVPSSNSVLLDPADFGHTEAKRLDAARTLNFLLPAGATAVGSAELSLAGIEDAGSGAAQPFAPFGTLATASFVATPPLRITVIGFSYLFGSPPVTIAPGASDFNLIRSWLRRAYPVAEVIWAERIVAVNAGPCMPPPTPETPPCFGCGTVNAQLAAIRALDVAGGVDARTHYYGLVHDGGFFMRGCAGVPATPNPAAVGSGPTGPASWGWDFDGSYGDWYCGHELGHTFGRLHPGFCGESQNDLANYPFENGQLSNADGYFAGFDVGDAVNGLPMAALPGVQWHDVMTYCPRQWLSSYTYQGIRQRLIAEDALSPGATMGAGRPDERFSGGEDGLAAAAGDVPAEGRRKLIQVIGNVNLSRQSGSIDYVLPLDRGAPSPPDGSSRVVIVATAANGEVLDRVPVEVIPEADEGHGPDARGFVSAIIAVHPDAARLELEVEGRHAATFEAGRAPGSPVALSATSADGGAGLRWAAAPGADAGARITYSVQLSADDGRSWQTVAVGLSSPEAAIDAAALTGRRSARVRVRASSGFEASETEFDLDPARIAAPPAAVPPASEPAPTASYDTYERPATGWLAAFLRWLRQGMRSR